MRFQTRDLEVKPFSTEDREAVIDLLTDETVGKTYMVPDFTSREDAGKLFDRLMDLSRQEGRYVAGIFREGACIGILNETEVSGNTIELGYAIRSQFHNRGYGTQVLGNAIDYFFDHGFTEVLTGAFEENLPSIRIMVKCGMEKLSRQEEITYRGRNHNCVYYSMEKCGERGDSYGKESLV
jgi:RimJ/RimL family protein N-acetyltransferase